MLKATPQGGNHPGLYIADIRIVPTGMQRYLLRRIKIQGSIFCLENRPTKMQYTTRHLLRQERALLQDYTRIMGSSPGEFCSQFSEIEIVEEKEDPAYDIQECLSKC